MKIFKKIGLSLFFSAFMFTLSAQNLNQPLPVDQSIKKVFCQTA